MSSDRPRSSLWQLFLARCRAYARDVESMIWTFLFPIFLTMVLGIAFRSTEATQLEVAVVGGPEVAELTRGLDGSEALAARQVDLEKARTLLSSGNVSAVVISGGEGGLEILLDPTRSDGVLAKRVVLDQVDRLRRGDTTPAHKETRVTAPGTRYVDFLVPGLIGFGLMSNSMGMIGYPIVLMRGGRMLKALAATPMRRRDYLMSFLLARGMLALLELLSLIVFAYLAFKISVVGSWLSLLVFGMVATFAFGALALLVAARPRLPEAASGLSSLVMQPMILLSGVFFPSDRFPDWAQPLIQLLPLTACNDGLRAIINGGAGISDIGREVAVLLGWGLFSFVAALRLFRWQ